MISTAGGINGPMGQWTNGWMVTRDLETVGNQTWRSGGTLLKWMFLGKSSKYNWMIFQQALFDLSAEDPRLAAGVILFNLLWCAMVLMDVANIF
jgi:hypothetical protein